jgi:DNA repair exonuclease SbcCD ATPase subunit
VSQFQRQNKLATLAEKQKQLDEEIASLEEQKRILESTRVQGEERTAKLEQLEAMRQEIEGLDSKLQHRAENGPEALQKAGKGTFSFFAVLM